MKKSIRNSIIVVVIAVILIIGYYFFPIKVNQELSGIKYRLGDSIYSEEVKVSVDGYLSNGLLHKTYFKGTVKLGDQSLEADANIDRIALNYLDKNTGDYKFYGDLIATNNMKELTVMIFDNTDGEWNPRNGLMLSTPAKTRDDALKISKNLTKKYVTVVELK